MVMDSKECLPAAAIIERAERIGTATWSDALDDLGIVGVPSGLAYRSGSGRCVGFAATASAQVGVLGSFETKDFGLNTMLNSALPGEVLVVEMGGAEISGMGGIGALAARNRGLAGVLIDGGCRDIGEIRACGLWVASRHVTPRTGKRRVKLMNYGSKIQFGGVSVSKGDLVIADETGIVIVARGRMVEVLVAAEQMRAADTRKEDALKAGKTLEQARSEA